MSHFNKIKTSINQTLNNTIQFLISFPNTLNMNTTPKLALCPNPKNETNPVTPLSLLKYQLLMNNKKVYYRGGFNEAGNR